MKAFRWSLGILLLIFLVLTLVWGYQDIPLDQLKKRYTNDTSHFVQVQGMNVHYRDQGSGPTLVLLHGTSSSLHTWDGWVKHLNHDFRLVRLDLPGFGLTGPHPQGDYSLAAYSEFLHAFAKRLKLNKFHIAGNSLGGAIAVQYTLDHGPNIQKLILIDPAGLPQKNLDSVLNLTRLPGSNIVMQIITPRFLFHQALEDVYADDSKISEALVDRYFQLTLRKGNRRALVQRMNTGIEDLGFRLKQIHQPTLLLWGRQDNWIPPAHALRFHERLATSKVIIYDNAGHLPMEELPRQSATDAHRFLLKSTEKLGRTSVLRYF